MYDSTMASTTAGMNATAPNLQADIGNSVALGGLDDDLLTTAQFDGSGSGLSVEQADALVQQYLQQFHSTEFGSLDPWMDLSFGTEDVEPLPVSADAVDSLTGLSPQATLANSQSPEMKDLGTILGAREFDGQGTSNPRNFYNFTLNSDSDLHINLEGASRSQNLWLYEVQPTSSAVPYQLIRFSNGWTSEPSTINLSDRGPGEYLIRVDNSASARDYTLNIDVNPTGGLEHIQGGLTADNWEFAGDTRYTVFSGEGNVNFGQGEYDLIDFSHYSIDDVTGWNPVTPEGGGMLFDPGNGLRLFDAMQLNDGNHILFEGIDRLAFADGQVDLAVTPNDPLFEQQWNLHMTGVHNAWRFTQGSEDVLIGIQDDGLEITSVEDSSSLIGFRRDIHPDLDRGRIEGSPWRDIPLFSRSHGTTIHSIAAAASNNQIGMSGINWTSNVKHADIAQPGFELGLLTTTRLPSVGKVIEATQAMIDNSADTGRPVVINMSLTLGEPNLDLENLIVESQDSALFVIATGNHNIDTLSYPANLAQQYDNVVSVGASWGLTDIAGTDTKPGARISYTEESHPDLDPRRRWGSNYGEGLTLMAPSEVIAADYDALRGFNSSFDYNFESGGTSSAAPHVTGIASLAWSVNPDLTAPEINSIMQRTAHDLSELGDEFEYGAGLVNADAAVRKAMASANPVSNWNASGDQPLSLASFIDQGAEAPVFGITATQFEPEHPVETVAETGHEAVADAAAEAAPPWWNFPVSLPTFDVNSPWANLDWQPSEIAVSQSDWVIPEFSVPGADWLQPTTSVESAALPTVDELISPVVEGLNEPVVDAIA